MSGKHLSALIAGAFLSVLSHASPARAATPIAQCMVNGAPDPARVRTTLTIHSLLPRVGDFRAPLDELTRTVLSQSDCKVWVRWLGVTSDQLALAAVEDGRADGVLITGAGLTEVHQDFRAFLAPELFDDREHLARSLANPRVKFAFMDRARHANGLLLAGLAILGPLRAFSLDDAPFAVPTRAGVAGKTFLMLSGDDVNADLFTREGANVRTAGLGQFRERLLVESRGLQYVMTTALLAEQLMFTSYFHGANPYTSAFLIGGLLFGPRALTPLTSAERTMLLAKGDELMTSLTETLGEKERAAFERFHARGNTVPQLTEDQRTIWHERGVAVRNHRVSAELQEFVRQDPPATE